MTTFALALALALAAPAASPPPPPRPDLSVRPSGPLSGPHGTETRCAYCHTAEDWKRVTFAHDKTGFPLTGRHRDVTCSACHPGADFSKPVPKACAACHRDVHVQRLGQRCERCHDTGTFKQASFGPGDHRRTAFPLDGRHAMLPCTECHGDVRDRDFRRGVVRCDGCHQKDYDRTVGAGPQIMDHAVAGFSTDCRPCHGTWRFENAFFPAHQLCFGIRSGPHAGIACRKCHTGGIPALVAGQPLTCSPTPVGVAPADCMSCHGNPPPPSIHQGVAGYLPSNPRCYECHRFASVLPRFGGAR